MSNFLHGRSLQRVVVLLMCMASLLAWLFIGIALGYSDEEPRAAFFLKKYATLKITFPNPDDSESDYLPFPELSRSSQEAITAYCKYRFGVVSTEVARIEACRRQMDYFTRNTRTP
jgi:hypothetical protein